ncbi:1-acyl-sn-glycerol-3-phosphate acyltransferase [bacterium]|nr:1-acyl-sn-glycerol-3-phosphate acyltransferase [bacterium]
MVALLPLAVLRLCGIVIISLTLTLLLIVLPLSTQSRAKVASFFFKFVLWQSGIRVTTAIQDPPSRHSARVVIVANHVNYLDVVLMNSLRPCVFLAKTEIGQWPLFGWVARSLGCVFVKRDSLMARANALRHCLTTVRNSDLALFPEGTTTQLRLPQLQAWTRGHAWVARKAGVDAVLCLALEYEDHEQLAWIDDMSLFPHLMKTLSRPTTRVKITGAWVPVAGSHTAKALALSTHKALCDTVLNECPC